MLKGRLNLRRINILSAFFFIVSGYYCVLILVSNLGFISFSRFVTIPVRLLIVLSLLLHFRGSHFRELTSGLKYFIVFSVFYLIRILYASLDTTIYHITPIEFTFYFVSFVLLPLYFICQARFTNSDLNDIYYAIMSSGLCLALLTTFYYGQLLGLGNRISLDVSKEENYISPLALSYSASMTIGLGVSYIATNKISVYKKALIGFTSIISLIPFFLGASRGSIFTLVIPFLIYSYYAKGSKNKKIMLIAFVLGILIFIIASEYLGNSVFDRLFDSGDEFESTSSNSRVNLWKASLEQVSKSPFIGDSLETTSVHAYPHNIIVEVLISTGVIGLIPFLLFIYNVFKTGINITIENPKQFWVFAIFLQAFIQYMFSGSIYSASWLAIGAGLVLNRRQTLSNYSDEDGLKQDCSGTGSVQV